ncbi:AMP-binding protein [Actinosynnema sp. NPDC050801]|uniref:AMP-binding protein n=1 Tax=unclassified Actinosynnema TaxID=2637065 RepID=UPI00340046AC
MPGSIVAALGRHARERPGAIALVHGDRRVGYQELSGLPVAVDGVVVPALKTPETVALIAAHLAARRPFLLVSPELGEDTAAVLREHMATWTPDEDVSFVLTTSGSTGVPKVVPLGFDAVERFTDWAVAQFGIGPGTAVLNYAPFTFDLCLLDVWATLKAGGTAVLVDPKRATDAKHVASLLRDNGVEVVQAVPMLFRLLLDAWDGTPFDRVRHVVLTGDKTSAPLLIRLPGMFPTAAIHNVYGCTETNDSFLHTVPPGEPPPRDLPIGRPLPGVDALIAPDGGETPFTVDGTPATGELLVRTPFQTTGYLDPADSAGRFTRVPGRTGTYFRSGDIVRRDADGVHHLLGRNDFQVKVRGTRINLEEVERVLLDHDAVLEAAVVGLPDDLAGTRLHAVVRGVGLDGLALRAHCRRRLPRVAIPSGLHVVHEPLPRTSTGKVDRQRIRRTALEGTDHE